MTGDVFEMATKKGLSSVVIDLDRPRTLRFPNGPTREFEEWALSYLGLPKTGVGMTGDGPKVFSGEDIIMQLTNSTLQTYALYFGLKHDDPDLAIEKVDEMITAYKEAGKNYDDLLISVQRAYLLSNHPSSLASQEERWRNLRKMSDLQAKIQAKRETTAKKKIAEALGQLEKQLQEIDSGEAPPDLPTPSD